jgi:hypothetical protein
MLKVKDIIIWRAADKITSTTLKFEASKIKRQVKTCLFIFYIESPAASS